MKYSSSIRMLDINFANKFTHFVGCFSSRVGTPRWLLVHIPPGSKVAMDMKAIHFNLVYHDLILILWISLLYTVFQLQAIFIQIVRIYLECHFLSSIYSLLVRQNTSWIDDVTNLNIFRNKMTRSPPYYIVTTYDMSYSVRSFPSNSRPLYGPHITVDFLLGKGSRILSSTKLIVPPPEIFESRDLHGWPVCLILGFFYIAWNEMKTSYYCQCSSGSEWMR